MTTESAEHSTIADIALDARTFEFGSVLSDEFDLELERIVPLGTEGVIPLVWLLDGDPDHFEATVADHSGATEISRLTTLNGDVLFEVRWTADVDGFLTPLLEHNVYVMGGEHHDGTWEFRLRFANRDDLVDFYEQLTANNIPVTLKRLFNPGPPPAPQDSQLTDADEETVEQAYRRGYFEVPRQTTIKALAAEEGISDSAYSQRLRRSLASVIESCLIAD